MDIAQARKFFDSPKGPFTVTFRDGRPPTEHADLEAAEGSTGGHGFEISREGGWHTIVHPGYGHDEVIAEIWPSSSIS